MTNDKFLLFIDFTPRYSDNHPERLVRIARQHMKLGRLCAIVDMDAPIKPDDPRHPAHHARCRK